MFAAFTSWVRYEKKGIELEARESYRRFYEYWKDGDLDCERVGDSVILYGSLKR